jgi:hypothetical protein
MRPELRALVWGSAFAAAFATCAFAIYQVASARPYGPYLSMHSLMERRQPVSEAAISDYAGILDLPLASCRSDIADAGISVLQRNIALELSGMNGPARHHAMRRMEDLLGNALACAPTDGDLWARLAIVRWYLGGSADEQLSLMTLSQVYSPSDLAVVARRLRHWRQVTPRMAVLAQDLVRADIRKVLLHAPPRRAMAMLRTFPPNLAAWTNLERDILPPERVEALQAAGLKLPL